MTGLGKAYREADRVCRRRTLLPYTWSGRLGRFSMGVALICSRVSPNVITRGSKLDPRARASGSIAVAATIAISTARAPWFTAVLASAPFAARRRRGDLVP